jgi:hypothetical protein
MYCVITLQASRYRRSHWCNKDRTHRYPPLGALSWFQKNRALSEAALSKGTFCIRINVHKIHWYSQLFFSPNFVYLPIVGVNCYYCGQSRWDTHTHLAGLLLLSDWPVAEATHNRIWTHSPSKWAAGDTLLRPVFSTYTSIIISQYEVYFGTEIKCTKLWNKDMHFMNNV